MKSNLKNCWQSRLCVFPEVKLPNFGHGDNPVYLNVYDLTPTNVYLCWAGVGAFHSGVEVHGVEYAFGAIEYPASGVFEVEPRKCPGFTFRKSIFIGTTFLNTCQVEQFMKHRAANYYGDTYHVVIKNCNNFSEEICYKLTGNRIPKWVNRLARIGSFCRYIIPGFLKTTVIGHDTKDQDSDNERESLRSAQNLFSFISIHQNEREVFISSLL